MTSFLNLSFNEGLLFGQSGYSSIRPKGRQKFHFFEEELIMAKNNDRKMSVEEAGRKGGKTTSENHDKEFYQEIGQKGGEATSENHDKEFYQEIGEKGGESRSKQRKND